MPSKQKEDFLGELAPLFLITVFVLIFFSEMIFASKIPLFRDLGPFFYPMRLSLAQSLAAGELPLWEHRMAMGFPLLANFQSGAFYLPNLVFLVFPFSAAIKATFILHAFVAALGAYFLLRHWGFLRPVALMGSLLFAFGGTTVSLVNLLNHFQTAVWLPWLLFCSEKQIVSEDRSKLLILVSVATLQFLAGSPEIYAMSMALLLLNNLRVKWEGRTSYGRVFSSLLTVNLLVAGLAMIQILPTWELLREASRYRAPSLQSTTEWSLHPLSLLNLLFLDKEIDVSSFNSFQSFLTGPVPLLMTLYMGALFPFGLWVWLLTEGRKKKTFLLSAIILSLLLSLGSHTPLYRLFYDYFPLIFLTRFPEKLFFLAFVLLLYAALQGLTTLFLQHHTPKALEFLLGPAVLCVIFTALYLFFRNSRESLLQLIGFFKGISPDLPLTWKISSGVLLQLERQIALLVGIGTLFLVWQKGKIQTSILQILMVGVVFVDLYSAHRPYLFLSEQTVLRQKPRSLQLLEDLPSYRIFFTSPQSPIHPIIALFPKARSLAEHGLFSFQALRPNTGMFWGVSYLQDIDALLKESYDDFRIAAENLPPEKLYRLLGILNVKYLISLQELPQGDITQIGHLPEYPLWVYRVQQVTPRAYIVPTAIFEAEPKRVIEHLAGEKFSPSSEVILSESVQLPAGKNFTGKAEIATSSNTRVEIRVLLSRSGILVLADSYYPGWRVYVDGREQEILRANLFFRGVLLSEGRHLVEFHYQPRSFQMGLIITLITVCGVVLGTIVCSFPKRRRTNRQKP